MDIDLERIEGMGNPGLGFGIAGPLFKYKGGERVRLARGKNKGFPALLMYEAAPHPLSSERRFYLKLLAWKGTFDARHVLMNESGFYIIQKGG